MQHADITARADARFWTLHQDPRGHEIRAAIVAALEAADGRPLADQATVHALRWICSERLNVEGVDELLEALDDLVVDAIRSTPTLH